MRTKMFVIDDGARHTICARDTASAYAEYVRVLVDTDGDWPDEWPTNTEVPDDEEVTIDLQLDLYSKAAIDSEVKGNLSESMFKKPTLRAREWCELVGERYLACSEY